MARRPLGPLAWVLALALAGVALVVALTSRPEAPLFRNGDAAVYAWQADNGIFTERVVHVGWVALGAALRPLTGQAWFALELWNIAAAATLVVGLTAWARLLGAEEPDDAFPSYRVLGRVGVDLVRVVVPWVTAWLLLPWVLGAEVDLPWMALLVLSVIVRWRGLSIALAAVAVTLSPTALLALPVAMLARWMAGRPASWAPVAGAVGAAVALSVGSAGDWLWADRGVLLAPAPRPWRSLQAWGEALLPALAVSGVAAVYGGLRGWRHLAGPTGLLLASVPMLLAPPDVFSWLPMLFVVVGLIAVAAPRQPGLVGCGGRAFVMVAALLVAGPSGWRLTVEYERVMADSLAVTSAVWLLDDDDALVATWSRGVRVSIRKTGDPYALRWRTPGGFVRDQQARWCAHPQPAQVFEWTSSQPGAWPSRDSLPGDAYRQDCP